MLLCSVLFGAVRQAPACTPRHQDHERCATTSPWRGAAGCLEASHPTRAAGYLDEHHGSQGTDVTVNPAENCRRGRQSPSAPRVAELIRGTGSTRVRRSWRKRMVRGHRARGGRRSVRRCDWRAGGSGEPALFRDAWHSTSARPRSPSRWWARCHSSRDYQRDEWQSGTLADATRSVLRFGSAGGRASRSRLSGGAGLQVPDAAR
jgi:hypothetical protein